MPSAAHQQPAGPPGDGNYRPLPSPPRQRRYGWRYLGWLAAKLLAIPLLLLVVWLGLQDLLPPPPGGWLAGAPRFGIDLPFTFAAGFLVLLGAGLVRLCIWDQMYRCRQCSRRLRMPQVEGSYSSVWLGGVPYTEYICTYGHGKLFVPDVKLSGHVPRWTRYESLWEDLVKADRGEKVKY